MAKTKTAPEKKSDGITGTYRYDKEAGTIVLVSKSIPKVASKGRSASKGDCGQVCETPRGGGCCGGGACAA